MHIFKIHLNHMQMNILCLYIWCIYNTLLFLGHIYGALIKMDNLGGIQVSHIRWHISHIFGFPYVAVMGHMMTFDLALGI
jgi:hypothetical protein